MLKNSHRIGSPVRLLRRAGKLIQLTLKNEIGRIFAGLSEGGPLPEISLKRVLKCDAVALEEASGRQLRCDESFGVIHLRVDCH